MLPLFIVNQMDCPSERLIAEKREDGLLYYINDGLKHKGGMFAGDATPLEDFGVDSYVDRRTKTLHGELVEGFESKAKYNDGKPRKWQGSSSFSFSIKKGAEILQ